MAVTDGKNQTLFELSKAADGRMYFYESYGEVRNFPRSYRLKRAGNPIDRDEEEEELDDLERSDRQDAEWAKEQRRRAEEMGAREDRANRRAATRAKKQKQAEEAAATLAAGSAEPTRRSSRVAANAKRQTKRPAGGSVPDIREDREEHHVGNFTAGLARGQDDLASLLNGLQGCEIRSELGSGSLNRRIGRLAVAHNALQPRLSLSIRMRPRLCALEHDGQVSYESRLSDHIYAQYRPRVLQIRLTLARSHCTLTHAFHLFLEA